MDEVLCFELINGQKIIGTLRQEKDSYIGNSVVLEDALVLNIEIKENADGQKGMQVSFAPISIVAKGQGAATAKIPVDKIFMQVETDASYIEGYKRVVSPIQLVNPGRIIT